MVLNGITSVTCRGHSPGVDKLGDATEGVVRGRGRGGWWRVEEYGEAGKNQAGYTRGERTWRWRNDPRQLSTLAH
jgi:hypothetical protein